MTRNDLVQIAMNSGLSYRQARKVVRFMLEEMTTALLRGEDVELPFGAIHPIKNKRPVRAWRFKKIVISNKMKYRFLFKQKYPWT